ncbi:fluoride efflux transporter CrcB [Listeria riparia]|uniref:Fluoride-specific ion channel FluC n=1 Tax=Listeria riparia FSL S10-1204 TaxID=1265816 RepID=W7DDX0_9LIST|nr:fluoride efflux transporter CrcB [Listeria riparia]EUJ45721.1 camphor resistance protein CrcB [Listeria riparia FSL S10-1204]
MWLDVISIAIGAFLGANARYALSTWIKRRVKRDFPIATLVINLSGAFVLGVVVQLRLGNDWNLLATTGFLGAFTTFSTFKLESIQLHAARKWQKVVLYQVVTYSAGLALVALGMLIGSVIM